MFKEKAPSFLLGDYSVVPFPEVMPVAEFVGVPCKECFEKTKVSAGDNGTDVPKASVVRADFRRISLKLDDGKTIILKLYVGACPKCGHVWVLALRRTLMRIAYFAVFGMWVEDYDEKKIIIPKQ